ncbi:MAG TPA: hypothetical protein VNE39_13260 [Planctomycetota bacterium]|nr:hypothetical protein [Planctomycetota bacterium]
MPVALQVLLTSILSLPFSLLDAWNAVASARLAARMKVVTEAGDPASMTELAKRYPDPPPGHNAAEFLNPAFKLMEAENKAVEQLGNRAPIVGPVNLPDVGEALPPIVLKNARAYLAANGEILALLHKAAEREDCKFDLDFAKGPGMLLPHLSHLRQGARLLALEAIERVETGKADEAGGSLLGALRMGECVRQEPILISALVRVACNSLAVAQMERWASRAKPSPAALERIEAALAAAADPKLIEGAMVGERCFGIDIYQTYVLTPKRGELLGQLGAGDMPLPLALRLIPDAYFKTDMCYYLDIMNDYVAAARKPYPESYIAGTRVGKDLEERIPRHYVVSRMILPALGRVFSTGQQHIARCESARVALAALRYRAKHGRLPADLPALMPDFLKAVPPDPFDGKPLRYKADGAGLTVYALGEDGKDDGGATQHRPDGKPLDIGFRVRWPKAEF